MWLYGLILKCVFETEVTIVMGVNWHRIGSGSELKMLYGNSSLETGNLCPPRLKAACMQNSVFNFQCGGCYLLTYSMVQSPS